MKKVLTVIHLPPPIHGASLTGEKIFFFLKKNFFVDVIKQSIKKNTNDRLNITHIFILIKNIINLLNKLFFNNYEIIYITPSSYGLPLVRDTIYFILIKIFSKSNLIIHFHSKGYFKNNLFLKFFNRKIFKNSTIIFPSMATASEFKLNFLQNLKVEILYGCLNNNFTNLNILKSPPILLFYSNLYKSKGILEFLAIIKNLEEHNNLFSFKIFGNFTDFSEENLKKIILEKNIKSNFDICGPVLNNDITVLSNCNILISPTYYETFGLSVLECMSLGIVPVVSDVGGLREIIEDNKNGFLIKHNNTSSFVKKVSFLLNQTNILKKMSIESQQTSKNKFSKINFENKLKKIFNVS